MGLFVRHRVLGCNGAHTEEGKDTGWLECCSTFNLPQRTQTPSRPIILYQILVVPSFSIYAFLIRGIVIFQVKADNNLSSSLEKDVGMKAVTILKW